MKVFLALCSQSFVLLILNGWLKNLTYAITSILLKLAVLFSEVFTEIAEDEGMKCLVNTVHMIWKGLKFKQLYSMSGYVITFSDWI